MPPFQYYDTRSKSGNAVDRLDRYAMMFAQGLSDIVNRNKNDMEAFENKRLSLEDRDRAYQLQQSKLALLENEDKRAKALHTIELEKQKSLQEMLAMKATEAALEHQFNLKQAPIRQERMSAAEELQHKNLEEQSKQIALLTKQKNLDLSQQEHDFDLAKKQARIANIAALQMLANNQKTPQARREVINSAESREVLGDKFADSLLDMPPDQFTDYLINEVIARTLKEDDRLLGLAVAQRMDVNQDPNDLFAKTIMMKEEGRTDEEIALYLRNNDFKQRYVDGALKVLVEKYGKNPNESGTTTYSDMMEMFTNPKLEKDPNINKGPYSVLNPKPGSKPKGSTENAEKAKKNREAYAALKEAAKPKKELTEQDFRGLAEVTKSIDETLSKPKTLLEIDQNFDKLFTEEEKRWISTLEFNPSSTNKEWIYELSEKLFREMSADKPKVNPSKLKKLLDTFVSMYHPNG